MPNHDNFALDCLLIQLIPIAILLLGAWLVWDWAIAVLERLLTLGAL